MTQTTDQERAEFEAVARKEWKWPEEFFWRHSETGEFTRECTTYAWDAWQAARRAQVVPDGWKLVPEVPTMEMVAAGDKSRKASSWLIGGANAVPATYAAMLAAAPQPPEEASTTKHKEESYGE